MDIAEFKDKTIYLALMIDIMINNLRMREDDLLPNPATCVN